LIKSMRAYSYADRSVDGVTPKFRAQRLNIQSYATDETMLLISMQWNYQAELSRDWFSREALNLSAAERRSRMEAFLTEHSEATSEEN